MSPGGSALQLLILLFLVLAVACRNGDQGSESRALEGAPVAVDRMPSLSLGVQAGDTLEEFHRVRTPFMLTDGRVVVPLGGENLIRVFDADGEFIETLGREGAGPGEFMSLSSAWSNGDTIEVADSRLRRITRFFPDGSQEAVVLREAAGGTVPPGLLDDAWVLGGVGGVTAGGRDDIVLHAISREGTDLGEIARIEGIRRVESMAGPHPLSPRAVVRLAEDRIFVGETESPRIRVLDRTGEMEREITWEVSDTLEPQAVLRAVQDIPELEPMYEGLFGDDVPDRLSVFWDFLVDELGFIWVRPYEPRRHAAAVGGLGTGSYVISTAGGAGRWLVFSPTGEPAGSIEVPEGLSPVQVTADALLGIHVDPLGVESVRIHSLTRN